MKTIIDKVEAHVEQLFNEGGNTLLFHNWDYKLNTINRAKELIENVDLDTQEKSIALIAAWFLDTGLLYSYDSPSEKSASLAREFAEKEKIEKEKIDQITNLVLLAKKDDSPDTLLERTVKDIANHFPADGDYGSKIELLKEELRANQNKTLTDKKWRKEAIQHLRTEHVFYTDYALENWNKRKKKNLKRLLKNKKKAKKLERKESLKAKFKNQIPDRGIQTLYRVTLRNHIKLSDIADTKANILLSVNAIIISLSLANLIPKLDNPSNAYLIYPTFIFIVFCIASMIMSIMATRPNVTSGEFTREDVEAKKVNLLFFGNFHKMELKNYEWAMMRLIQDRDYIYNSLTKDLYYLGVVLERKYRLLRWTYTVFMIGMILSVIAFGVALKFYGPERVLEVPELPSP